MIHPLLTDDAQCCGCGTCAIVCPVGAIEMVPKELGSLYPKVHMEKCIDCQKCIRYCAYQVPEKCMHVPVQAFAAVADNKELLKKSASGGVFATIADAVLNAGGAVFGCAMEMVDEKLKPIHICVEDKEKLVKLQGSKYVQSELGDTVEQIKTMLEQGRTILFSGTPCQVDTLKRYTKGVKTGILYTIDLVCHGVPSAKLFQDYLTQIRKERITSFSFRDKTFGWGLYGKYSYIDKHGREKYELLSPNTSSYYTYFLSSEIYRQSCYSCGYAQINRVGDLTIGDFWGIENEHPEYLDRNGGTFSTQLGISAVIVNTPKGKELLNRYGGELALAKSQISKVKNGNSQLNFPSRYSNRRFTIIEKYNECGYSGVEELFRRQLGLRYYLRQVKMHIKKTKKLEFEE